MNGSLNCWPACECLVCAHKAAPVSPLLRDWLNTPAQTRAHSNPYLKHPCTLLSGTPAAKAYKKYTVQTYAYLCLTATASTIVFVSFYIWCAIAQRQQELSLSSGIERSVYSTQHICNIYFEVWVLTASCNLSAFALASDKQCRKSN